MVGVLLNAWFRSVLHPSQDAPAAGAPARMVIPSIFYLQSPRPRRFLRKQPRVGTHSGNKAGRLGGGPRFDLHYPDGISRLTIGAS
jgi:hypothetical protein